jgi:hypothetical protein
MQLRSGLSIRGGLPDTGIIECRAFRVKCRNFIGELNDSACSVNTLHILYRMYNCIYSEIDNISSHLNLYNGIKPFLLGVANNIPKHIIDILACERTHDMEANWNELTGFAAIEIGRMMYELRSKLFVIIDEFNRRRR